MTQYLEVGKIVGCRGLKGELKIHHYCDNPDAFLSLGNLYLRSNDDTYHVLNLDYAKEFKSKILLKSTVVNNLDEAQLLVGQILYSEESCIPMNEGKYFIKDVIGLEAIDIDTGLPYGVLTDVITTGANDVYVINDGSSKEALLPAVKEVVKKIDLPNKKLWVCPIKGIFND